jgi:hypothetical protein
MILKAQSNGLFVVLAADLIDKGMAVLQYADDTVLCFEHEPNKAVNIKLLLYVFEIMSGLKINFAKSKVLVVGGDNITGAYYAELFSCQVGHFPMKYLGVPVSYATLRNSDSDFLDTKSIKKLDAWVGNSMSSGGRLILLDYSLSNVATYRMSMFYLNDTFIEKMNKHHRWVFWQHRNGKKSYHLVKWSRVCRSKIKGGLRVKDLRKMNISLLCKWWWKLET